MTGYVARGEPLIAIRVDHLAASRRVLPSCREMTAPKATSAKDPRMEPRVPVHA